MNNDERRLAYGESSFRCLYKNYRWRANRLKHEFELRIEDFGELTKRNCFYCGAPPCREYFGAKGIYGPYVYNGLDRVDNNVGYTLQNVVACCFFGNRAKSTMSQRDFLLWVSRVAEHQRSQQCVGGEEKLRLVANTKT